jgi:hypothetical protein
MIAIGAIIVVVLLIAAILGFAATRPDTFRVQRTVIIHAIPEKIFMFINDLHNWERLEQCLGNLKTVAEK